MVPFENRNLLCLTLVCKTGHTSIGRTQEIRRDIVRESEWLGWTGFILVLMLLIVRLGSADDATLGKWVCPVGLTGTYGKLRD